MRRGFGAPCAVRRAPGAVRRRIHEAGLGDGRKTVSFSFSEAFLFTKASAREAGGLCERVLHESGLASALSSTDTFWSLCIA